MKLKLAIAALIVVGLLGCEIRTGPKPRTCTTEQLAVMSKYVEQCERGFLKHYCFSQAEEAYCKESK